jgi:hypothetical protein
MRSGTIYFGSTHSSISYRICFGRSDHTSSTVLTRLSMAHPLRAANAGKCGIAYGCTLRTQAPLTRSRFEGSTLAGAAKDRWRKVADHARVPTAAASSTAPRRRIFKLVRISGVSAPKMWIMRQAARSNCGTGSQNWSTWDGPACAC